MPTMRILPGIISAAAGGDDPYEGLVSLFLDGNGLDGSTTFTDRSFYNRSATVVGNTQVDTSQSKFGGASMLFDGSGDYLQYDAHKGFWLENKDFTIEAWVRVNWFVSASHYPTIIGQRTTNTTSHSWTLCIDSLSSTTGRMYFAYTTAGNNPVFYTGSITLNQNQWYHIALVRNGSSLKVYVDGVADIDQTIAVTIYESAATVKVGAFDNPAWSSSYMNGWIDSLRFTKGAARYTANFVPPTKPFKEPADFNPAKLPDILFWLDAANRGVETNQWDDLSGNDNHLTSPAAANFPTFAGGVATFDGSTDFVDSPSGYASGISAGEIFLRQKRYADNSETGTNTGWMSFGTHNDNLQDHFTYAANIYCGFGSITRKSCGNPAPNISLYRTINVWSAASDWGLKIDGSNQYTTASNTVQFSSVGRIGASWYAPGGGVYFQGDIKQVAMYGRKLWQEERDLVETYMAAL